MSPSELFGSLPPRLVEIAEDIQNAGGQSFLVGGWVRDALLGHPSRDFDVEVYGLDQDALLSVLKKHGRPNLVGKSYGVIHLVSKGQHFDFSFPRLESKTGIGHRGFAVETRPDLDFYTAALRRDFTINAMGMHLPHLHLVDPHGGEKDLKDRILRHVSAAFSEDPLRVLRAVQFAARFELSLSPETIELCHTLDIRELSRERFYEEFRKWLCKAERPSFGLVAFRQLKMEKFFPWISPSQDFEWNRLGSLLDEAAKYPWDSELERMIFMFAILCEHSGSRDSLNAFLESLSNEVQILRQVPQLREAGPELWKALENGKAFHAPHLRRLALVFPLRPTLAWVRVHLEIDDPASLQKWEELKKMAMELGVFDAPPEPFLSGKTLMELGQKPGKHFGEWIAQCFEEQLEGKVTNAAEAREWARQKILLTSNGTS